MGTEAPPHIEDGIAVRTQDLAMNKFVTLLSGSLLSAAACAQGSPPQQLQKHFVNSCVARAIAKQDDAVQAARFCSCAFEVLAKELTVQEYIQMDKASRERGAWDSGPVDRLKPKLTSCKN
jgi:hypothetical protein